MCACLSLRHLSASQFVSTPICAARWKCSHFAWNNTLNSRWFLAVAICRATGCARRYFGSYDSLLVSIHTSLCYMACMLLHFMNEVHHFTSKIVSFLQLYEQNCSLREQNRSFLWTQFCATVNYDQTIDEHHSWGFLLQRCQRVHVCAVICCRVMCS